MAVPQPKCVYTSTLHSALVEFQCIDFVGEGNCIERGGIEGGDERCMPTTRGCNQQILGGNHAKRQRVYRSLLLAKTTQCVCLAGSGHGVYVVLLITINCDCRPPPGVGTKKCMRILKNTRAMV